MTSSQVEGFRAVPTGHNSAIFVERNSIHPDPGDYAGIYSGKYIQEYRLQLVNEPGSRIITFDWICESQGVIHTKQGQIVTDVPVANMIYAREELSIYMNENQEGFGYDMKVAAASWRK